jgi:hypothetical protein
MRKGKRNKFAYFNIMSRLREIYVSIPIMEPALFSKSMAE